MAELATIARPYAQAAFRYAQKHERTQAWSEMLDFAAEVVRQPAVAPYLEDPRVGGERLMQLFAHVAEGRFDAPFENFLRTLVEQGRVGLLPEVSALFEAARRQVENRLKVHVVSAYQVKNEHKKLLTEALEKRYGKAVELTSEIDKSLIGGLVIRAGDSVIDASVTGGLQQLASGLSHS
jgi:F-type H+-transporting ATPase subunit delta